MDQRHEQTFVKRIANNYMEKFVIGEIKIKQCEISPHSSKGKLIRRTKDKKYWQECGGGTLHVGENVNQYSHHGKVQKFLKNLKIELS